MKKIAIFTHHDLDGIFAAFLLQEFYQKQISTKCFMIAGSAGCQKQSCINAKIHQKKLSYYDQIILTDFVPTIDNCQQLMVWQSCHYNPILIFDHHPQSYSLAKRFPQLTFILPPKNAEFISASLLVINWLKHQNYKLYHKYYTVAQCVSAYDTFAFSLQKDNRFYRTAPKLNMLFYHLGIDKFMARIKNNPQVDTFSESERHYFEQQTQQIKQDCEQIQWQHLSYQITTKEGALKIWLITYLPKYASEISNIILTRHPELDIIILSNSTRTIFRTRRNNLDMDKLAQRFHGGGHLKAAGANTNWIKVNQYLKSMIGDNIHGSKATISIY